MMRPRLDDRAVAAGTAIRFLLLIVLIVIAVASMADEVIHYFTPSDNCAFAAGADPNRANADTVALLMQQWSAYRECRDSATTPIPCWGSLAAVCTMLVAAMTLFAVLTRSRSRGHDIPVRRLSAYADIEPVLARLIEISQLGSTVRFVVDPTALSAGAVVVGRTRHPTVRLHAGLLTHFDSQPKRFQAVVLHELAHIRNRDVSIAYAIVAIWRVFLVGALVPYTVWTVWRLVRLAGSPEWQHTDGPYVSRELIMTALIVVLVYVVRADALRTREVYADRTAARWGADPAGWAVAEEPSASRWLPRLRARVVGVFSLHPPWSTRRTALDDPVILFRMFRVPTVAVGAVTSLIAARLSQVFLGTWVTPIMEHAASVIAAALLTGIIGYAAWRAAIFSAVTSQPMPSGAGLGVHLGTGLLLGQVVTGPHLTGSWIPSSAAALLFPVVLGICYCWWCAQCSVVWVRSWSGRSLRGPLWITMIAGFAIMYAWLTWWADGTRSLSAGSFDPSMLRQVAASIGLPSRQFFLLPVFWLSLTSGAAVLIAVSAAWIAPLLAWAAPVKSDVAQWAPRFLHPQDRTLTIPRNALPPIRGILLPALAGALTCWCTYVVIAVTVHTLWPPVQPFEKYLTILVALYTIPTIAAATTATALALGRIRTTPIAALVSAQIAVWLGFFGDAALLTTDGCLPPASALDPACNLRSETAVPFLHDWLPALTLVAALSSASVIAALAVALRRSRTTPHDRIENSRASRSSRRWVAVLCAAALTITTPLGIWTQHRTGTPQVDQSAFHRTTTTEPRPEIRAIQIAAWFEHNNKVPDRIRARIEDLSNATTAAIESHDDRIMLRAHPACATLTDLVSTAKRYFRVPDDVANIAWQQFLELSDHISQRCAEGLALLEAAAANPSDSTDSYLTPLKTMAREIPQALAQYASFLRRTIALVSVDNPYH